MAVAAKHHSAKVFIHALLAANFLTTAAVLKLEGICRFRRIEDQGLGYRSHQQRVPIEIHAAAVALFVFSLDKEGVCAFALSPGAHCCGGRRFNRETLEANNQVDSSS